MPIYDYGCKKCKGIKETIQLGVVSVPECCGTPMRILPALPVNVRTEGQYPSRKKWMDNWTPDSPKFSTGSLHGEKY